MSLHCTTATLSVTRSNFKAWPYKGRRKNFDLCSDKAVCETLHRPFPITRGSNFLPENVTAPRQPYTGSRSNTAIEELKLFSFGSHLHVIIDIVTSYMPSDKIRSS